MSSTKASRTDGCKGCKRLTADLAQARERLHGVAEQSPMALLSAELAETKGKLAEANSELAETKDKLAETKDKLAETKGKLAEAKCELAETKSQLTDAKRTLREATAKLREAKHALSVHADTQHEQHRELNALREQLEKAEQEANRQAARFRRRAERLKPEDEKGRPGAKEGHKGAWRQAPEVVDETAEVPLHCCPHCRRPVTDVKPVRQVIENLITRLHRLALTTYKGTCPHCGEVRSTHPEQVSTATGAAGTHLGLSTLALVAELNKHYGLTMHSTCKVLKLLGLPLTPGGLSQALDRVADRLTPSLQQVIDGLRHSSIVHVDETSWWLLNAISWLWVFTNDKYTIYRIGRRTYEMVEAVLGTEFGGILVSDCLNIYDQHPGRQSKCMAHHLKAIKEALVCCPGSQFLLSLRHLLKDSIQTHRDCITDDDRLTAALVFNARLDAVLNSTYSHPDEARIANRLISRRPHILRFMMHEDLDATNNQAERQLRPIVITRKLSAGNRTERGARTLETLKSLTVTCRQLGRDFRELVAGTMGLGLPPPEPLFVAPHTP